MSLYLFGPFDSFAFDDSFAPSPFPSPEYAQIVRRPMARPFRNVEIAFPNGTVVKLRVDEDAWHDPEVRERAAEEMIAHLFSIIDHLKADVDEVRAVVYRVLDMDPESFTSSISAPRVSRPRKPRARRTTEKASGKAPVDEPPLDPNRLAFVKYLVEHGVFSEWGESATTDESAPQPSACTIHSSSLSDTPHDSISLTLSLAPRASQHTQDDDASDADA